MQAPYSQWYGPSSNGEGSQGSVDLRGGRIIAAADKRRLDDIHCVSFVNALPILLCAQRVAACKAAGSSLLLTCLGLLGMQGSPAVLSSGRALPGRP